MRKEYLIVEKHTSQKNLLETVIGQDQELVGSGRWLRGSVNSSLIVDTERQLFYFNTKDIRGNVLDWLTKVKGFDYHLAKEYITNFEGFLNPLPKRVLKNDKVIVPFGKLVDTFHDNYLQEETDYWEKRGITLTSVKRFRLGKFYNELQEITWNTVPIFLNGEFYNFQLRTDFPEKMIRYYYKGLGPMPFNFDVMSITDSIIICEGPTDCIRLSQEGVPCVSHNAGSAGWRPEWFSYFIKQKKITILYDNDEAGRVGAKRVAENLGVYRAKIYTFGDFEKHGYDIIDFFRDGNKVSDLIKLIEQKAEYAFSLT